MMNSFCNFKADKIELNALIHQGIVFKLMEDVLLLL